MEFEKEGGQIMIKKGMLILSLMAILLFSGCKNIRIQSPEGKTIKLGHKSGEISKVISNRSYYLAWGIVPITNNTTDRLTKDFNDGDVIAAEVEYSPFDWLIECAGNGFIPTTIAAETVNVEKIK